MIISLWPNAGFTSNHVVNLSLSVFQRPILENLSIWLNLISLLENDLWQLLAPYSVQMDMLGLVVVVDIWAMVLVPLLAKLSALHLTNLWMIVLNAIYFTTFQNSCLYWHSLDLTDVNYKKKRFYLSTGINQILT